VEDDLDATRLSGLAARGRDVDDAAFSQRFGYAWFHR
jgi:hypothetical protein